MRRAVLQVLAPEGGVAAPVVLTANTVPKATSMDTIGNSSRTDDGVTVNETLPVGHNGNPVINPQLIGYTEKSLQHIPAAALVTLDWLTGNVAELALAGNTTIAFSNVPASPDSGRMSIGIVDTPGASVITWPVGVDWGTGGAPPVLGAGDGMLVSILSIFGGLWGQWVDGFT